MQVMDCLTGVRSDVCHEPKPGLVDAFPPRYLGGYCHDLTQERIVRTAESAHIGKVSLRNDQDMRWRLRRNVSKGNDVVALHQELGP